MSWNVEILAVKVPESTSPELLVPDVFAPTDEVYGWSDASSCMRDKDLSVAWCRGWGLVSDVLCRLSGNNAFLEEVAEQGEVYIFRIANDPIEVHCRAGKIKRANGLKAVAKAAGVKLKPDDDGETIARQWLLNRIGVDFFDDFDVLQFSRFELP